MPASLSRSKAASLRSEAMKYSLQCFRYNSFSPKSECAINRLFLQELQLGSQQSLKALSIEMLFILTKEQIVFALGSQLADGLCTT